MKVQMTLICVTIGIMLLFIYGNAHLTLYTTVYDEYKVMWTACMIYDMRLYDKLTINMNTKVLYETKLN